MNKIISIVWMEFIVFASSKLFPQYIYIKDFPSLIIGSILYAIVWIALYLLFMGFSSIFVLLENVIVFGNGFWGFIATSLFLLGLVCPSIISLMLVSLIYPNIHIIGFGSYLSLSLFLGTTIFGMTRNF